MSPTTFAIAIWAVIALGWIGFLIIAAGLAHDAIAAMRHAASGSESNRSRQSSQ